VVDDAIVVVENVERSSKKPRPEGRAGGDVGGNGSIIATTAV